MLDYLNITPQWQTLELAIKIGRWSLRIMVNLRSIGNYIDARECTARRIKIEAED